MKPGDLVRCKTPWGPDTVGTSYHPIGIVLEKHPTKFKRWRIQWISPFFEVDEGFMTEVDLEIVGHSG
mgnify:FL=1|tara:strand:- start:1301 stop:1504 length:204 start_codon:yes stop_codon:yes gene_type:complete